MRRAEVEVWRGATVESVHRVSVAVVDVEGRLRASAGDPGFMAVARSAVKPIQAVPVVEDGVADRFAFSKRELALCCASHSGEASHVELACSMLRRIGVGEEALVCGAHEPMHAQSADALRAAGHPPRRVHNNCSGKHIGMLALAVAHGWPVAGYERADHPVQARLLGALASWTGVAADEIPIAVDGCGVITYALPLHRLARAFAAFAAGARAGDATPRRIVRAMVRRPEYVGGTGRLCTELMRAARGRIFAKGGAEGVYCAGIPGAELGIALKVEDGANRAAEPALIGVLRALGLLSNDEMMWLAEFAEPDVKNTRWESVGRIRALIDLEVRP